MKLFDECGKADHAERLSVHQAADEHAASGGQALHVWDPDDYGSNAMMQRIVERAPACFKRTRPWAHLQDYDLERLKKTARALGVRIIVVGREGRKGQHIDLCAGPLQKAIKLCSP